MPEFSKFGEYYRDALLAAYNAGYEAEQDPDMAESFRAAARQAMLSIEFLEPDALQEYKEVISYVPPIDPAVETERSDLMALQSTPAYRDGLIKDKVDQRLASLPVPETYSREDLDFAHYILSGLGITSPAELSEPLVPEVGNTPEVTDSNAATEPAESPDTADTGCVIPVNEELPVPEATAEPAAATSDPVIEPETKEHDNRKHVKVSLYLKDGVIVIGGKDGLAVPIAREAKQSSLTPEQDSLIEEMRLLVLAYFVNHPEEQSTTKVWNGLVGNKMEYNSSLWYTHMLPFIRELKAGERRLILDRKPTPDAKRRYYRLNPDIVPDIEVFEEESGRDFFTIFKVVTEEGRSTIAGATGKLGNLLVRSSADNPLSLEKLLASGIFSEEEIAAMDEEHKDTLLSGMVSSLRSSLRDLSADHVYKVHSVKDPVIKRPSGKPTLNYWMERLEIDPDMQSRIDRGYAIAKYIEAHNDRIEGAGLPVLSSEVAELLAELLPQKRAEYLAEDFKSARKYLSEELDKFNDPRMSDELFDSIPSHDHPLSSIFDYMFGVVADSKQDLLMRALHPKHGTEFVGKHSSGRITRQEAMRQMDGIMAPAIREALDSMNRAGIFREDGIMARQVMNVWHGLHSGKLNRYIGGANANGGLLTISDVVQAFLRDKKEFAGYFSRPADKRRIAEIIDREIGVFKENLKAQTQTD